MFPLLLIGGLVAVAAASKKKPLPGPAFTYGVAELHKGHAYQFEATIEMPGVDNPGEFAHGIENGLAICGAWGIYIAPALPLRVQYSLQATDHRPLSVGAPFDWHVGDQVGRFTVTSVREVAKLHN